MTGSIGPKWFGLRPTHNSGSGNTTISDTWILICFTIHSYKKKSTETTNFSVFCIFWYFSSLSTKHNARHKCHNHGRRRQKLPPSAPHEALHSTPTQQMDGQQPSKLADVFGGGRLRVCMALKVLLCSGDDALSQRWSVLRTIHTLNSPKNYIRLLRGLSTMHWIGAQGLMWGTRGSLPAAAAIVCYGCVGQCWLLEADIRSTYYRKSNNCLQKYFFLPTKIP